MTFDPWTIVAWTAVLPALLPAAMTWANLREYLPAGPPPQDVPPPRVAVLIPARNEEGSIGAALEAATASRGVDLDVFVWDDESTDRTAEIVREFAARDTRVKLLRGSGPPAGWNGKQHACFRLAEAADAPLLAFLDADVRLQPDGLARAIGRMRERRVPLLSGVPFQETGTPAEQLLIPLIHFVLLGFLPMQRMRASTDPAYAAGCGQFFLADRDAYFRAGGHAAIRETRHDGIRLPRAFRAAGLATDLVDATDLARCRMYRTAGEVHRGLVKNATEGLARPALILPMTFLLAGGQIVPTLLLFGLLAGLLPTSLALPATLGVLLGYFPRLLNLLRFRQSPLGALLHPLGIFLLLLIQWEAFFAHRLGRSVAWKGRPA